MTAIMPEPTGELTTETQRHREGTEKKGIFPSLCGLCVSVPLWLKGGGAHERLDALVVHAGALKEGVAHHLDIWREAVKADKLCPKLGPIGEAELAFLPAALEVSETPASPLARATAATIAAFMVLTVAWASIGELDIVATASGKIIPSERVKQIQPLETSIVRAVNVAEGQEVKAGDVLVELEVTGGLADVNRLKTELNNARVDAARPPGSPARCRPGQGFHAPVRRARGGRASAEAVARQPTEGAPGQGRRAGGRPRQETGRNPPATTRWFSKNTVPMVNARECGCWTSRMGMLPTAGLFRSITKAAGAPPKRKNTR